MRMILKANDSFGMTLKDSGAVRSRSVTQSSSTPGTILLRIIPK